MNGRCLSEEGQNGKAVGILLHISIDHNIDLGGGDKDRRPFQSRTDGGCVRCPYIYCRRIWRRTAFVGIQTSICKTE